MCNYLHETSKRNWKRKFGDKKCGIGYKCFSVSNRTRRKNLLRPVWRLGSFYRLNKWIKWNKDDESGDGFCFFLTLEDAKKFRGPAGISLHIRKIRFREGLGYHMGYDGLYRIALCKEFKILNEVKNET